MKLDHIALNAVDLESEIDFFVSFLGLQLLQKWESPRQAYVGQETGPVIGLIENPKYDGMIYTMAHIAFDVSEPEFNDWVQKVESSSLNVISGPKEQRGGRTILFRSPSNNIIELCYPYVRETIEKQSY